MRININENKILNEAFLACAAIISGQLIHGYNTNKIVALCEKIPSIAIVEYLKMGLELIECAYESDYINVILEYEYQRIDKSTVNCDELKTLVILNKTITRLFQENDIDFFYSIYSQECTSAIRDQLSTILHYQ